MQEGDKQIWGNELIQFFRIISLCNKHSNNPWPCYNPCNITL